LKLDNLAINSKTQKCGIYTIPKIYYCKVYKCTVISYSDHNIESSGFSFYKTFYTLCIRSSVFSIVIGHFSFCFTKDQAQRLKVCTLLLRSYKCLEITLN